MFALFVSHDCGISYHKECEAETLDELRSRMKELDDSMLRWYLEKDGKGYWEEASALHKGILHFMERANKSSEPTDTGGLA